MKNLIIKIALNLFFLVTIVTTNGQSKDFRTNESDSEKIFRQEKQFLSDDTFSTQYFNWQSDIQPILESVIEVKMIKFLRLPYFTIKFTNLNLQGINSQDSIWLKIASILVDKENLIIPLTAYFAPNQRQTAYLYNDEDNVVGLLINSIKLMDRSPRDDDIQIVEEYYINHLLNNTLVLELIMPSIHAVLEYEGIVCEDCPGPAIAPPEKSVNINELMRYIIYSYKFYMTKTGDLLLLSEVPTDTLPDFVDFDINLSIATKLILDDNKSASSIVKKVIDEGMTTELYRNSIEKWNEEEEFEFLKSYISMNLPQNQSYLANIKQRAVKILPQLNLICIDCE